MLSTSLALKRRNFEMQKTTFLKDCTIINDLGAGVQVSSIHKAVSSPEKWVGVRMVKDSPLEKRIYYQPW